MDRFYHVIIVFYISFIIFLFIHFGEANGQQVERQKRFLTFRNISHFFMRFNFKANIIPWNQIFVQAVGYRVNWDEPPDSFHPHHITRRSVFSNMEMLLDRNGFDGFHCVQRAICETKDIEANKQIYFKILKIIFGLKSLETEKWRSTEEDCQLSLTLCPFSLLDVSTYTDI